MMFSHAMNNWTDEVNGENANAELAATTRGHFRDGGSIPVNVNDMEDDGNREKAKTPEARHD